MIALLRAAVLLSAGTRLMYRHGADASYLQLEFGVADAGFQLAADLCTARLLLFSIGVRLPCLMCGMSVVLGGCCLGLLTMLEGGKQND